MRPLCILLFAAWLGWFFGTLVNLHVRLVIDSGIVLAFELRVGRLQFCTQGFRFFIPVLALAFALAFTLAFALAFAFVEVVVVTLPRLEAKGG